MRFKVIFDSITRKHVTLEIEADNEQQIKDQLHDIQEKHDYGGDSANRSLIIEIKKIEPITSNISPTFFDLDISKKIPNPER